MPEIRKGGRTLSEPINNIRHPTKQSGNGMEAAGTPKLKRVRRLDSICIENDATYFTGEGYLVDHPILTSCGIFEYVNPDGSIRRELRLPEHVFAEESLKTYKGKPIIITHEAGSISKDNVDREQIGTILGEGYRDGDDVRAEIIIHDTNAMKKSGLKELSLGYNLDLIEEPGVWNGQPYDAVQTNIVINHLALVASARAGEQARLNIDGSDEDEPELKGGRVMSKTTENGGISLTPEQLMEAIHAYVSGMAGSGTGQDAAPAEEPEKNPVSPPAKDAPEPESPEPKPEGSTPREIMQNVKDRKETRTTQEDAENDIDMLLACLENLLSEGDGNCGAADNADSGCRKGQDSVDGSSAGADGCGGNKDGAGDNSQSMNADSADAMIRQRLSICRVGDRLHMDGLEDKTILDGKKAIINKVLPNMRLDGKSSAYIDAAYDMAVSEAMRRKDVNYQRQQMMGNGTSGRRMDSAGDAPTASAARQRMIDREGGK